MPRPTLLTPAKKDIACALRQAGASRRCIARIVGVSEATVRYGIKHDLDFAARFREVEALYEVDLMLKLSQSAGRSWRAAVHVLEAFRNDIEAPPEYIVQCELDYLESIGAKAAEESNADDTSTVEEPQEQTPDTSADIQLAQKLTARLNPEAAAATTHNLQSPISNLQFAITTPATSVVAKSPDVTPTPTTTSNPRTPQTTPAAAPSEISNLKSEIQPAVPPKSRKMNRAQRRAEIRAQFHARQSVLKETCQVLNTHDQMHAPASPSGEF